MKIELYFDEVPYTSSDGEEITSGVFSVDGESLLITTETVNENYPAFRKGHGGVVEAEIDFVGLSEIKRQNDTTQIIGNQDKDLVGNQRTLQAESGLLTLTRSDGHGGTETWTIHIGEELTVSFIGQNIAQPPVQNDEAEPSKEISELIIDGSDNYSVLLTRRTDDGIVVTGSESARILLETGDSERTLREVSEITVKGEIKYGINWYVGNDFGNGEIRINEGDTLLVKGGKYDEQNGSVIVTGTKKNPITIDITRSDVSEAYQSLILEFPDYTVQRSSLTIPLLLSGGFALALAVIEAVIITRLNKRLRRRKKREPVLMTESFPSTTNEFDDSGLMEKTAGAVSASSPALTVGKLHNIGKRPSQQDSIGTINLANDSVFAVVADGMGGLSDGDKVSQQIVYTMIKDTEGYAPERLSGNLIQMVAHANNEVKKLLGNPDKYVSGSTLVAVLAEPKRFRWISVGDSRVYLYRGGALVQLNREHIYETELLNRAVNGEISFRDARSHEKKKSVSSFIGMGNLKYIDEAQRPVTALSGDRIILSSDGVFNSLSDTEMAGILDAFPDPAAAAQELEKAVLNKANQYQDNFSAIVIAYM